MPYSDKRLNTDELAAGALGCSFLCVVLMLLVGFVIFATFVFRHPLADVGPRAMEQADRP